MALSRLEATARKLVIRMLLARELTMLEMMIMALARLEATERKEVVMMLLARELTMVEMMMALARLEATERKEGYGASGKGTMVEMMLSLARRADAMPEAMEIKETILCQDVGEKVTRSASFGGWNSP